MNDALLLEGFRQLESLAIAEYRIDMKQLLGQADTDRTLAQVGRLIGVLLKEPFATPTTLSEPSHRTGAYRAWELGDEAHFNAAGHTWQYKVLEQLRVDVADKWVINAYQLARDAQNETGFFGYLARDLRMYICGDKAIRAKVAAAIKAGGALGAKLPSLTPEAIVGAGGLTLGAFLVQQIPVLGFAGAPVIAAVVVILYRIGVDAFCSWTDSIRTDETEKN